MTVYAVAQLRFADREAYDRYQARFLDIFSRSAGRILAADEHPTTLEGTFDRDKIVILAFPSEPEFRAWFESPEYLEIARERQAGADAVILLVRGLDVLS
jgi:uncharacterized protein (DUF1330 family)